jgi:hypothetical protein
VSRRGFVFYVKLNEIQYSELQKVNDTYRLLYENEEMKADITFKSDSYNIITDQTPLIEKKKSVKLLPAIFLKRRKGSFDFIYEVGLKNIDSHDFKKGPFTIKLNNRLFTVHIIIKLTQNSFKDLLRKTKDEYEIKSQKYYGKTVVRVRSETKLDPFDRDDKEMIQTVTPSLPYNKSELAKHGIYLTHPNSFKRCYNCANYNNKECTAFKSIEVSENHSCRRFYNYRTYFGGSFSPR